MPKYKKRNISSQKVNATITARSIQDLPEYSNKKIAAIAGQLGYYQVKSFPFNSHGQPAFKKSQTFISHDIDQHQSTVTQSANPTLVQPTHDTPQPFWKKFDNKGNRLGTFDIQLHHRLGN